MRIFDSVASSPRALSRQRTGPRCLRSACVPSWTLTTAPVTDRTNNSMQQCLIPDSGCAKAAQRSRYRPSRSPNAIDFDKDTKPSGRRVGEFGGRPVRVTPSSPFGRNGITDRHDPLKTGYAASATVTNCGRGNAKNASRMPQSTNCSRRRTHVAAPKRTPSHE